MPGGQSTPLCGGVAAGAAGRRPEQKKTQTWTFAFFSTSRPPATVGGCPSPFEPFMKGLRRRERSDRGNKPNLFAFAVGEARRRGGGTMEAAAIPTPECEGLEGGAALGGRSTRSSPRCLALRVNVAVCLRWGAGFFCTVVESGFL
jgi:hypothetical protein